VSTELNKPGSVEPTLLNVIVGLATLDGDAALYDRYLARAKAATDPEEKYRFLYGLAGFGNPALVRRTMDLILSPEVRAQDAKVFVGFLLRSRDSRELAWDLLRQRWDELQKKDETGNAYVVGALGMFCDAGTAQEIRTFFKTHKAPDAERTLAQTLERIESCARFAASQRPHLETWLKKTKN
jgi:aminopeptidase N